MSTKYIRHVFIYSTFLTIINQNNIYAVPILVWSAIEFVHDSGEKKKGGQTLLVFVCCQIYHNLWNGSLPFCRPTIRQPKCVLLLLSCRLWGFDGTNPCSHYQWFSHFLRWILRQISSTFSNLCMQVCIHSTNNLHKARQICC